MPARYSDEEKAKIIEFVNNYDAKHGRGGKLRAVKKFKVAPLTLRAWLEKPEGRKIKIAKNAKSKTVTPELSNREKIATHINKIELFSNQIVGLKAKIEQEKADILRIIG
jgi:hypothetical protein